MKTIMLLLLFLALTIAGCDRLPGEVKIEPKSMAWVKPMYEANRCGVEEFIDGDEECSEVIRQLTKAGCMEETQPRCLEIMKAKIYNLYGEE